MPQPVPPTGVKKPYSSPGSLQRTKPTAPWGNASPAMSDRSSASIPVPSLGMQGRRPQSDLSGFSLDSNRSKDGRLKESQDLIRMAAANRLRNASPSQARVKEVVKSSRNNVRVYFCSTGEDMLAERIILQDKAFPVLTELCRSYGLTFQPVDLWWGVSERDYNFLTSPEMVRTEIDHCLQASIGPCFCALIGDRYGRRILPQRIPMGEFDTICNVLIRLELDVDLLETWYKLDENSIPAAFHLQPMGGRDESEAGQENKAATLQEQVYSQLQEMLYRAAQIAEGDGDFTEDQVQKYSTSALERDTRQMMLGVSDAGRQCLAFTRSLQTLNTQDPLAHRYLDYNQDGSDVEWELSNRLKALKQELASWLPRANQFHYDVPWNSEGVQYEHMEHGQYLEKFCFNFLHRMSQLIQDVGESYVTQRPAVADVVDWLLLERVHHSEVYLSAKEGFYGRENHMNALRTYLCDKQNNEPFVFHGEPGCGKTYLMAKAVEESRKVIPGACVAARFLGTSSNSSSFQGVLKGIVYQICETYSKSFPQHSIVDSPSALGSFFTDLLGQISARCSRKPLVIIMDGVHVMYPDDHVTIDLSWLPTTLPKHIKMVLTVDSGEVLDEMRKELTSSNLTELGPFDTEEALPLLLLWLRQHNRTLSDSQQELLQKLFEERPEFRDPLALRLLVETVGKWEAEKEYDRSALAPRVSGAIKRLFNRLEDRYGAVLTKHMIGYLALARNGLSESEMADLLSMDNAVMQEILGRYSLPAEEFCRAPILLWCCMVFELDPYLRETMEGGHRVVQFQHSKFVEMAVQQYASGADAEVLCNNMADLYLGTWSDDVKKDIKTGDSSRELNRKLAGQKIVFGENVYNYRKLKELPHYLLKSGRSAELSSHCIGRFDWLWAKRNAMSLDDVIADVDAVISTTGSGEAQMLRSVLRLVQIAMEQSDDQVDMALHLLSRMSHLQEKYPDNIGKLVLEARAFCKTAKRGLLIPSHSCFPSTGGALKSTLIGHNKGINDVALSENSFLLASASNDHRVKLWDLKKGVTLQTMIHDDRVTHVALLIGAAAVAGLGTSGKLIIWSMITGRPIKTFSVAEEEVALIKEGKRPSNKCVARPGSMVTLMDDERLAVPYGRQVSLVGIADLEVEGTLIGHNDDVTCLAVSADDKFLITGGADNLIQVWNPEKACQLHKISVHEGPVTDVVTSEPDWGLAASEDRSVAIFDLNGGIILHHLKAHAQPVFSVAVDQSGKIMASGCENELKVWNIDTGLCMKTLKEHHQKINCVKFVNSQKQENLRLLSASQDGTVRTWNVSDGSVLNTMHGVSNGKAPHLEMVEDVLVVCSPDSSVVRVVHVGADYELATPTFTGHIPCVTTDGKYVISADVGGTDLLIFDMAAGGKQVCSLPGHMDKILCLSLMKHCSQFASGSTDRTVKVWKLDGASSCDIETLTYDSPITDIATHPSDNLLAVYLAKGEIVVRYIDFKEKDVMSVEMNDCLLTALDMGEDVVVYGTDRGRIFVRYFENPNLDYVEIETFSTFVNLITVGPGLVLAHPEGRSSLRVWNMETQKLHCAFDVGRYDITTISWSRDFEHVLVGCSNGDLYAYGVESRVKEAEFTMSGAVCGIESSTDDIRALTKSGFMGVFSLHTVERPPSPWAYTPRRNSQLTAQNQPRPHGNNLARSSNSAMSPPGGAAGNDVDLRTGTSPTSGQTNSSYCIIL